MASHQIAIAQASLSAALLRPDPSSISREEIAHFHTLLNSVIVQCSPQNVQKCKQWILANITQSAARSTALGKYLTVFTAFPGGSEGHQDIGTKRVPSPKRQRLHILYLVNDLLHHAKYRFNDASICSKIQPMLVSLVGRCASFKESPKHQRKLLDLLQLWEEKNYYSGEYVGKLREAVSSAQESGEHKDTLGSGSPDQIATRTKSIPYVMPASHGDASTPWFDLPAGNLMPHIIPNSTRPINPDMIKPLRFVAGPADEILAQAVKKLLNEVQVMFAEETDLDEKAACDIDELGQPITLDEITGDVIDGEGYYGWSRNFCEKMMRRKKRLDLPKQVQDRDRQSRSPSSSPGGRKRRYSDCEGSHDGHRRRRVYSSSRSPSPMRPRYGSSRSRSRSKSRSRTPPLSRSPPNTSSRAFDPSHEGLATKPFVPPIPTPFPQVFNPAFPPQLPIPNMPFHGQAPFGAWPPPPPIQFNPNQQQFGAWLPPPPPPFPPFGNLPQNYPQQQTGEFQQQQLQSQSQSQPGNYSLNGSGSWQGSRDGYNGNSSNNHGWNGSHRGGRGGYRGRGW